MIGARIGDHLDRLIVKAIAVLGFPLDAWPADRDVRRAMRGEPVRPEWMNGPVAGDAAGTSSGAVSMFPVVPAPERPDLLLQAMAIEELYAHHQLVRDTPSTIKCSGCQHTCQSERRHWQSRDGTGDRHGDHGLPDSATTR